MVDYKNSDMSNIINEYVRNPRYRSVLQLRFCDGATYDEISRIVDYSPQHVKYICKSYKDYLFSHL